MAAEKQKILFTGAVKGVYATLFQAICLEKIKDVTFYDQTQRVKAAIERERKLVEEGWAEPWGPFKEGKSGTKGPPKVDADIRVELQKDKIVATHKNGKRKTFSLDVRKSKSFKALEKAITAQVRTLSGMLKWKVK